MQRRSPLIRSNRQVEHRTLQSERLAAERLRKEKAAAKTAETKMRHDLYMSLDRPWDPKDFGQGEKTLTDRTAKNIREALQRCRLHAPPLPDDLDAMWTVFLDLYPAQRPHKVCWSHAFDF